ncbi:type II toxin-antitoxin system PemK/MazF family toxin [Sphingomonas gilva]|uniref:Type II toxin-antitoxin system PemK/MazF family toxin n=1 Tax=Sphingomonas gilva TaxID=2305907 RepID=A0A396RMZ6_9SPHN|nr:type II toxin-antitoxin system PemK/MazF family toxin [Sphingomonas gilva]RHW17814.1 type II toxin-antitoxin system PemK/MazF family toxin [Sphingomonas gilva]
MKRGDLVTVAMHGTYGKPRPAVIVQSNFLDHLESVLVCPLTSDIQPPAVYRIDLLPDQNNGLRKPSQIMVDKLSAVPRDKVDEHIGALDPAIFEKLNGALAAITGLLD